MKRIWTWLITAALAFTLATPAMADGKGRGHGKSHGDRGVSDNRGGGMVVIPGGRYDDRHDHKNGRPPGWSKGKKKGWGNCDLPPGQAKKRGCRSTWIRGHDGVWRSPRPRTGAVVVPVPSRSTSDRDRDRDNGKRQGGMVPIPDVR